MIPSNTNLLNLTFDFAEQPTKTYQMDLKTGKNIRGYTDELEAMKQAIFKILNTERYQYLIYSWNYGIELADLFGEPISYVCPELERRIVEALTWDQRILDVTDFTFDSPKRGVLHTTFTAHTIFGDVQAEKDGEYLMYENVTYELLLERMLGRVSDKFDKREGSVIWDSHSPTAIEFQILYLELDTIIRNSYGDTAAREFLIRRCKERGITPYPASHAVLKGIFSPADIDVTGKKFSLDVLNYVVLERISGDAYQVRCETPGIIGHQHLGKLIPIEYINGLTNAELVEVLIPGEDEEETEVLRQRYFDSFKEEAFGGNVRDYLEKVHAIPGVGSVKVTRVWNCDIRPAEMIPTPRVNAWYREIIGTLEVGEIRSWLDAVYAAASQKKLTTGGTVLLTILGADHNPASDVLIETVQNTIDPPEDAGEGYGLAPIGHVVTVKSADAAAVYLTTRLLFEEGYSWDNLQAEIEGVISNYLLELRRGWEDASCLIVRLSQIEARLLSIKGVIDIQDTALNGSPENLVLGRYEVPVFGGAAAC